MRRKPVQVPSIWLMWGGWAAAGLLLILLAVVLVSSSLRRAPTGFGTGLVGAAPPSRASAPPSAPPSGLTPSPGRLPAQAAPSPEPLGVRPSGEPFGLPYPPAARPGAETARPRPQPTPTFPAVTREQELKAIERQAIAAVIAKWSELKPKYYAPQVRLQLGQPNVAWTGGLQAQVAAAGLTTNVLAASQLTFQVLLTKYTTGWRADQVTVQGLPASPLVPPAPAQPPAPATPPSAR